MDKHRRAHRWAFPLGVLLTALAVVGAVTLARLAAGGIRQQIQNPKEKQAYEAFLAKIVVHGPDPFDSVGAVPVGSIPQLLDISIWSILRGPDAAPGRIPWDPDTGELLLGQERVAAEFEKIFGEPPPIHASIEGSDFDFVYDPEEKIYRIPVTGSLSIYLPRVRLPIKKTGGAIELTVDYLAYNDYQLDARGLYVEPTVPAKTMLITLYAQADEDCPYRVGAIRQTFGADYVAGGAKLG
ncbi:MAG: hypothetical protein FWE98_04890 [Oscillospiraceae bacterium]|nr:hypothetical protein [Oscillospiraceae bacterium]